MLDEDVNTRCKGKRVDQACWRNNKYWGGKTIPRERKKTENLNGSKKKEETILEKFCGWASLATKALPRILNGKKWGERNNQKGFGKRRGVQ